MYNLLQKLLFTLDAERAHDLALKLLHLVPRWVFSQPRSNATIPKNKITAMGLDFPHPIGLAAGLDKNADHLMALDKLGFAFIEIGTVTPRAQSGNPRPRLFRIPQATAIINRMGFNSCGVDAVVANIQASQYSGILGINIGKNISTPLSQASDDYQICMQKVYPYAAYIVINISSPNTPGLRQLQHDEYFTVLISRLCEMQQKLADQYQRLVPLLVKISPDENVSILQNMVAVLLNNQVAGIIATNTTCSRSELSNAPYTNEEGGLSGTPLKSLALRALKVIKSEAGDALTIIGVGGIDSVDAAQERLNAGATLVQLYTGLIYHGPRLIEQLRRHLVF